MESSHHPSHTIFDRRPWVLGGSIFYLASAVCILTGVYQIIVPIYKNDAAAMEKFGCLLTLNVYELLLLAVTLLIVVWRHVTDDAILLTFLIAAFLIGSATALDTVAPGFPGPTLAFGAAGLLLAAGKLYAMGRWITGRLGWLTLAGLGALLAWNSLMPGLLGLVMAQGLLVVPLREAWLAGGLATLAGGVLLIAAAWRVPTGHAGVNDYDRPFLCTAAMRWAVILLLLVGVFIHQYALNWAFGLNFRVADMLPALALLSLLFFELRRGYALMRRMRDLTPLFVPLVAVIFCIAGHLQSVRFAWNLGVLYSAPFVAIATAVVIETMALLRHRPSLHALALGYLVTGFWGVIVSTQALQYIRTGWLFVALAFPILLLGALVSLCKPRPRAAEPVLEPVSN
ncbi:MAG: hypothetical protein K8S99_16365 [Planctomycetes bacterium]|nr:hypothetical protein [Planctomycetota bacterium]